MDFILFYASFSQFACFKRTHKHIDLFPTAAACCCCLLYFFMALHTKNYSDFIFNFGILVNERSFKALLLATANEVVSCSAFAAAAADAFGESISAITVKLL